MGKREFTFRYKVRNWPAYNRALVRRGRLTLWFDESAVAAWRDTARSSGPGRPKVYANAAIECALILKSVFHLSLRATQGFLGSVVTFMRLELPVPDYSTMSRRQAGLAVSLPPASRSGARHAVVDSTGLKVYGAGEWHAGKYRRAGRRAWRKLHLGVDETTKEILAADVTASRVHDSRRLPTLLSQIPGCPYRKFHLPDFRAISCGGQSYAYRAKMPGRATARPAHSAADEICDRDRSSSSSCSAYMSLISSGACSRPSQANGAISTFLP